MKKFVWLFGLLLLLSFIVPTDKLFKPVTVVPVTPATPSVTDARIVEVLAKATDADRANIGGIYTGLKTVITRDGGQSVNNTERWSVLQARTLQLAVEQVGKYPGLDKAIEAVFLAEVGADDVVPVTPDTVAKLVKACDVIINSACPTK
jgi:hypothetical protein